MAQIILRAMLTSRQAHPREILVSDKNPLTLKKLVRELGVFATHFNPELARHCEIIWVGLKPYQAREVLKEIRPHLRPNGTVLSMMAGVSTQFIKRHLGNKIRVIRLMPNTPALVGAGITGVHFPKGTPSSLRRKILKILKAMGHVIPFPKEKDLDAVTGVSGSGAAFLYLVAEGMIEGGKKAHLGAATAKELTLRTFLGAARMLEASGKPPRDLIAQVVSKGGTTEAGLKVLDRYQIVQAFSQAVLKATHRAKKIREENDRCMP